MQFARFCGAVWTHWEARFGTTFAVMVAVAQYFCLEFVDPKKLPSWVRDFPPSLWLSVGAVLLFWACYGAWREQYNARGVAEAAIYDGRPLFVLKVIEQPSWKRQNPKAPVFELINCGKRAARHVYLASQPSHLKSHALNFVQIVLLSPDCTETLWYGVDQHGADQRALYEFLSDNPKNSALVWWDIKVTFRDANDVQGTDTIRLCFDVESQMLYTTAVPFTERKPTQQP